MYFPHLDKPRLHVIEDAGEAHIAGVGVFSRQGDTLNMLETCL